MPVGFRYIVRMDYDKVRGWWVRVPKTPEGHYSRLFSDGKYNGSTEALLAAIKWRNSMESQKRPTSPSTPRTMFSKNTSGCVGVTRVLDHKGRPCGWKAYWNDVKYKQKFRKFLYRDYGKALAYEKAVRCRKRHERLIRDDIRREVSVA